MCNNISVDAEKVNKAVFWQRSHNNNNSNDDDINNNFLFLLNDFTHIDFNVAVCDCCFKCENHKYT
jgi:hypothetical protein